MPVVRSREPWEPASDLTIVVGSRISWHAARPIIDELLRRGVRLHAVVSESLLDFVRGECPSLGSLTTIEALAARYTKLGTLATVLRSLGTPRDYAPWWERSSGEWFARYGKLGRLARRYAPKWRPSEVNRGLRRILGQLMPHRVFPSRTVLIVTHLQRFHLACARGHRFVSLVESWDHPSKFPVGYTSDAVCLWNEPLERDWQDFQGDRRYIPGYPVKLHYAVAGSPVGAEALIQRDDGYILYPFTFCGNSNPAPWAEEQKLVLALCAACTRLNLPLLIKSKPNGRSNDLDFVRSAYPNVLLSEQRSADQGANYDLDAGYNAARLRELAGARLVVNFGTTFAFDAAAYGLPVLQLRITDLKNFPNLSNWADLFHLQRHLLRADPGFAVDGPNAFDQILTSYLEDAEMRARVDRFSRYLRGWIWPRAGLRETMRDLADYLLEVPRGRAVAAPTNAEILAVGEAFAASREDVNLHES